MVQDRNLPEGTDRIVPGAAATGDDAVAVKPADTTTTTGSSSTGGNATGRGSSSGGKIMDKVRTEGGKLSGQASSKARDFVGQGLERSAESLSNVSRLVSDTAEGIDERLGGEYGDYARRIADAIDSTAEKLRSKNPEELIDDTREFVRKSPTAALAGAAILGFAAARLLKTGLDAARNDRDEDPGSHGGTATSRSTDSSRGTEGVGPTSRSGGTGSAGSGSTSSTGGTGGSI